MESDTAKLSALAILLLILVYTKGLCEVRAHFPASVVLHAQFVNRPEHLSRTWGAVGKLWNHTNPPIKPSSSTFLSNHHIVWIVPCQSRDGGSHTSNALSGKVYKGDQLGGILAYVLNSILVGVVYRITCRVKAKSIMRDWACPAPAALYFMEVSELVQPGQTDL